MNPTKMAEKQRFLARTASGHPDHRFTNLYDLLHWDYWMHISAERVLARPGSQTDGVDSVTRIAFKADYERHMTALIDQLKRKTYTPQPVRRVYIWQEAPAGHPRPARPHRAGSTSGHPRPDLRVGLLPTFLRLPQRSSHHGRNRDSHAPVQQQRETLLRD